MDEVNKGRYFCLLSVSLSRRESKSHFTPLLRVFVIDPTMSGFHYLILLRRIKEWSIERVYYRTSKTTQQSELNGLSYSLNYIYHLVISAQSLAVIYLESSPLTVSAY